MKSSNFVIVAHARSGSQMLISLLDSHPFIDCSGEKFNRKNQEECDFHYAEYIAPMANNPSTITGFKLSYPLRTGKRNDIWSKIRSNKQVKVIHLYRSNLLRAYLSWAIATKTEKWMGRGKQPTLADKKIKIDTTHCRNWISRMADLHTLVQYDFRHHALFSVSYENFLSDPKKSGQILDFLEVNSVVELSTDLVKQNPEPLDQLIENYESFAIAFQKTKWGVFL